MKYNFDIDLESKNSLSIIINKIERNTKVLEFGPANGRMTKYLNESLDCKVYTVEIDKDAAQDAAEFSEKIIVENVESYGWIDEFKNIEFDYIIFADILEHLYYPENVLKKAKSLLKHDGSIFISIPNIAHNSILINLLQDQFTYKSIGLLDNTHIRFFTKNTLDELISKCGLEIQYETATYSNPENTEFQNNYSELEDNFGDYLMQREYGEVYQFVIEAKKNVSSPVIDFNKEESAILFYDTGLGFNEDEKIISSYSIKNNNMINFTFENPLNSINQIRIDPLDKALCIKIKSLKVNDIDFLNSIVHNGKLINNNEFLFLHKDPNIIIDIKNDILVKTVSLHYEKLSVVCNVTEMQIQEKNQQLEEKNQQLEEKELQINDKEVHIQNLNNEINHLQYIAQSLRIKNRIKRIIKKYVPNKIWNILRYIKNNPSSIVLGIQVLKTQGFSGLFKKIQKIDTISKEKISNSYTYIEPILTDDIKKEISDLNQKPLISIIMPVYNVDPKWLELAIKSIKNQWYENWELCIVDDKSINKNTITYLKHIQNHKIKIKFLEENLNISRASNEALKLVSGEYIALMDNDDELTVDALYEIVKIINKTGAEFIYSDEDKMEMDSTFCDPHFKPDFAADMFLSQNYASHLGVIKKTLIDKVKGFTLGLEGAQDYDLYLKILEHTDKIHHISKVLYHWRKIPGSTAVEFGEKSYAQEAGNKALQEAMKRRKIPANIESGKYPGTYRVKYEILNSPLVSIIIPFKDMPELLTMCIESIINKSTYKNFEIIGISNNSTEKETFDEMKRFEDMDNRIKFYEYNVPFNYSEINNHAVNSYAKGEHILLLNNDIEIITEDWIESMLEHSQREMSGCVGAKLYYPNDTIQHAGIVIAIGGIAGHSHKYFDKNSSGYFSRLDLVQNFSAVTAACLMVKKSIFDEVNGLNEKDLKIAFNDVDFCLRVQELGFRNIFTPYCEAYHHESISRGAEDNPEKIARFNKEVDYMKKRHRDILEKGDPFYNPNLTLNREDFSLR